MAGVGFELNKLLAKQGYTGLLQAYGYAALIGSGPWLVAGRDSRSGHRTRPIV